jgi:Fe2+ transport system protein B
VILKPSHGLKILRRSGRGGFSPQAEYIFRKQIEEADFVLLNRIDELTTDIVSELKQLIESNFPGVPCLQMSAITGQGFDAFCRYLDQPGSIGTRVMEVDYDIYAEGEAELGWLNAQASLSATSPFSLDQFVLQLIERIGVALHARSAEVAHLKAIGIVDEKYAVANLVSSTSVPVLSIGSGEMTLSADLVINARVAAEPDSLTETIQTTLHDLCSEFGIQYVMNTLQCFKPGRPVPTHRLTNAV